MGSGFDFMGKVLTVNSAAIVHILVFLIGIGYAQNYYFHLRKCGWVLLLSIHTF